MDSLWEGTDNVDGPRSRPRFATLFGGCAWQIRKATNDPSLTDISDTSNSVIPINYTVFMDFFGALIEKIEELGFTPLAPSQKSKATYTLHTAVRDQLGMAERTEVSTQLETLQKSASKSVEIHITSDMADVAFWDYKALRAFLIYAHDLLNDEVSIITGNQTNAVAWSHDPSRSQSDVVDLLKRLQLKHPNLQVPMTAQKRISAKLMVQNRRCEAAIANTLAVLAANGSNYGDLLEQCAQIELTNESLLDFLDAQVEKVGANRDLVDRESLVPRELVVAYLKQRSDLAKIEQGSLTFCQFLKAINDSNNFAGNTDDVVLSRLSAHIDKKV